MIAGTPSIDDLLAGTVDREVIDSPGKSGAELVRVTIDGTPYVVKFLDPATDWTMRAAGVAGGPVLELWRRGVLDLLPDCLNQPIVGVGHTDGITAVLMHDVGEHLVPADDSILTEAQNARFLDHMARMHAAFWSPDAALLERIDVVTPRVRYLELSPSMAEREAALGSDHIVPQLVGRGWPLLAEVAPKAAEIVVPLAHDPARLVDGLAVTPQTFVHGNWKLDNLGSDDAGRSVVLDWELPGSGAALSDLAWYLAINCRRLPVTKEAVIEVYRGALESHGIDTEPWWDRQLGLSLLGALVQFGWEKALGGYDDELAWWERHAADAAAFLP